MLKDFPVYALYCAPQCAISVFSVSSQPPSGEHTHINENGFSSCFYRLWRRSAVFLFLSVRFLGSSCLEIPSFYTETQGLYSGWFLCVFLSFIIVASAKYLF